MTKIDCCKNECESCSDPDIRDKNTCNDNRLIYSSMSAGFAGCLLLLAFAAAMGGLVYLLFLISCV